MIEWTYKDGLKIDGKNLKERTVESLSKLLEPCNVCWEIYKGKRTPYARVMDLANLMIALNVCRHELALVQEARRHSSGKICRDYRFSSGVLTLCTEAEEEFNLREEILTEWIRLFEEEITRRGMKPKIIDITLFYDKKELEEVQCEELQ